MISVLAGPSHSLTTLGQKGQVSKLRPFPSVPGAPVGKALPGRYALRNGRKLMAKLNINGKMRDVRVEADTPLLWVIREHVGLTGTKYGCGVAQCGACSVHINGEVKRSCSIPVGDVKATDKIVTIEGLSASSSHPVQKAWAMLDVPPRVRPLLGDPALPLVITEGPLKADAAASVGLACVDLLGVWSWRGRNESDGLVAIPDWEYVALNGRQTVIAFDSDVMLKSEVYGALRRLAGVLKLRGAEVAFAYLPSGQHGEKLGLDDFFAAGHSPDEFWSLVTEELRSPPSGRANGLSTDPALPPPKPRSLAEVEAVHARWFGDTDPIPLRAVLGTYAAHKLPGDPVWLLLVGGSGIGKTEVLISLDDCPGVVTVSTVTEAGFLSGTSSKERSEDASGGLLRQIGERGVLVLKDFTSILSMNRDTRAAVIAALREIHDGQWSRHVGVDGGLSLNWSGKIGVVAGCTTAWDSAHAVLSAMGDRFIICRLPEVDGEGIGERALGQVGQEVDMRTEMREAVAGLFAADSQPAHVLGDDRKRQAPVPATLVARARSPVERDYQGEICLVLDAEAPTRLVKP